MSKTFPPPVLFSQSLTLVPENASNDSDAISGNLEASGERTFQVLTDVAIRRGTELIIKAKGHILNGIVETSTCVEQGFYIQIRLNRESQWARRRFTADYLPRLEEIASQICA